VITAPALIGLALAPAIVGLGRLSGLDRDRALYPVTLIVIAAYYVLFATMGGAQALPGELMAATVFVVVAIVGFRTNRRMTCRFRTPDPSTYSRARKAFSTPDRPSA
jgi:hypothetical protein